MLQKYYIKTHLVSSLGGAYYEGEIARTRHPNFDQKIQQFAIRPAKRFNVLYVEAMKESTMQESVDSMQGCAERAWGIQVYSITLFKPYRDELSTGPEYEMKRGTSKSA